MDLVDEGEEVEHTVEEDVKDQQLLGIGLEDEVNNVFDGIFALNIPIFIHNIQNNFRHLRPSHLQIVAL